MIRLSPPRNRLDNSDFPVQACRLSLWLDFGYMATYGTFTALLIDRARRESGHPTALAPTMIVAVAADAVEGISLLKVLNRKRVAVDARRAQTTAHSFPNA